MRAIALQCGFAMLSPARQRTAAIPAPRFLLALPCRDFFSMRREKATPKEVRRCLPKRRLKAT